MARQKEPQVEILPPESRLPMPVTGEGDIRELVRHAVAEISTNQENWTYEPYYRQRVIADEIRKLQTVPQRKKMAKHYELYGCWRCHKNVEPHGSIGFCEPCYKKGWWELHAIERDLEKA